MSVLQEPAPARIGRDDQASQLRALMQHNETPEGSAHVRTGRRAAVIAVASGKGGVGKTSLSVNLAASFAANGSRVTLVDGDLGLANADVLCGRLAVDHLGHVLDGIRTLDEVRVEVSPGFTLVPGGSGVARLADLSTSERMQMLEWMDELRLACDVLLMDCGAGIGRAVLSLAASSDQLIVVSTPEPTAIADAYALIKSLIMGPCRDVERRPRIGIVVNQVDGSGDAAFVHRRISTVAERFLSCSPELVGWIRSDRTVREAARRQRPFTLHDPRAKSSRDVMRLASVLERDLRIDRSMCRPEGGALRRILRRCRRHRPDIHAEN